MEVRCLNDPEYISNLISNKIIDVKLYYLSTYYKLNAAKTNLKIIKKIIENLRCKHENKTQIDIENARKLGIFINEICVDDFFSKVDFCGEELDIDIALNKLFFESVSLIHSFFDNYAQWINLSLFGGNALKENKVSLKIICDKLEKDEYYRSDLSFVAEIKGNDNFVLIDKLNNTIKHRFQVFPKNSIDIFNGIISQSINLFDTKSSKYIEVNCVQVIENSIMYCEELFNEYYLFTSKFHASPPDSFLDSVKNRLNLFVSDGENIINNLKDGEIIYILPVKNFRLIEPDSEISFKSIIPKHVSGILKKIDNNPFNKQIPVYYKYVVKSLSC